MTTTARAPWRAVVVPSEHGGWGLTLEPALLGLLVAPSVAGGALAIVAFLAFLVRTPLKLVLVDRRRNRELERDQLARRVVTVEVVALVALVVLALALAGPGWVVPLVVALPLFGVELWYDARSRGRRLVPELCGAVGISAVAASIAIAGGEGTELALALWVVLAARAVASVPFARAQVMRLRAAPSTPRASDLAQAAAVVLALIAVVIDRSVLAGAVAVVAIAFVQLAWSRGPARPAKLVGFMQLGFGLAVVVVTAIGVAA